MNPRKRKKVKRVTVWKLECWVPIHLDGDHKGTPFVGPRMRSDAEPDAALWLPERVQMHWCRVVATEVRKLARGRAGR